MNYFTDQQVRSAAEKGIGKDWDVFTTLDEVRALMNLAVSTAIGEPKAWVAFADNENLRIWTSKKDQVVRLSEQVNFPLNPLYAVKELPNG
jgi:hypothetical protein